MNVKNVHKFITSDGAVMKSLPTFSEPVIKIKLDIQDGRVYKKFTEVNAEIVTR